MDCGRSANDTTVANNGLEALSLINEADRQARRGGAGARKPYDVVLMDLEMPGERCFLDVPSDNAWN
jgi:CheY-like chemotaxis protein